jgi:hypothetical protein
MQGFRIENHAGATQDRAENECRRAFQARCESVASSENTPTLRDEGLYAEGIIAGSHGARSAPMEFDRVKRGHPERMRAGAVSKCLLVNQYKA